MGLTATGIKIMVADVDNAEAVINESTRYIFYNQHFISSINASTKTDWAALSILAHEIGHHLNGHTLEDSDPDHGSRLEQELAADKFSGFILGGLDGVALEDAQLAIEKLCPEKSTETHPGKAARLTAVAVGFEEAKSKGIKKIWRNGALNINVAVENSIRRVGAKNYPCTRVNNQVWMAQNLELDDTGIRYLRRVKEGYGKLYNWDMAMKACPVGWKLPSDEDWQTLINNLGGKELAGGVMKDDKAWENVKNTVKSKPVVGFNAVPSGGMEGAGSFTEMGQDAIFWTSTENRSGAMFVQLKNSNTIAYIGTGAASKENYYSVRCLEDANKKTASNDCADGSGDYCITNISIKDMVVELKGVESEHVIKAINVGSGESGCFLGITAGNYKMSYRPLGLMVLGDREKSKMIRIERCNKAPKAVPIE